jgi:hypothetical protein
LLTDPVKFNGLIVLMNRLIIYKTMPPKTKANKKKAVVASKAASKITVKKKPESAAEKKKPKTIIKNITYVTKTPKARAEKQTNEIVYKKPVAPKRVAVTKRESKKVTESDTKKNIRQKTKVDQAVTINFPKKGNGKKAGAPVPPRPPQRIIIETPPIALPSTMSPNLDANQVDAMMRSGLHRDIANTIARRNRGQGGHQLSVPPVATTTVGTTHFGVADHASQFDPNDNPLAFPRPPVAAPAPPAAAPRPPRPARPPAPPAAPADPPVRRHNIASRFFNIVSNPRRSLARLDRPTPLGSVHDVEDQYQSSEGSHVSRDPIPGEGEAPPGFGTELRIATGAEEAQAALIQSAAEAANAAADASRQTVDTSLQTRSLPLPGATWPLPIRSPQVEPIAPPAPRRSPQAGPSGLQAGPSQAVSQTTPQGSQQITMTEMDKANFLVDFERIFQRATPGSSGNFPSQRERLNALKTFARERGMSEDVITAARGYDTLRTSVRNFLK